MKRCFRSFRLAALFLMFVTSLSACAGLGGTSWKEQVLLDDGSTIIVRRSQSYGGRHEIGQSVPVSEHTISFSLPGSGKRLSWTSEYGEDLGHTNFHLLALHILNDTAYLVTEPNGCISYNKWGRPDPPYVIFRNDGQEWQRIPLSELPAEFKTINLVVNNGRTKDIEWASAKLGYVSAEGVMSFNSSLSQPQYGTILREPLANGNGCPIPTTFSGKPVAPIVNGQVLYYNWWPLATDWLKKNYGAKNNSE